MCKPTIIVFTLLAVLLTACSASASATSTASIPATSAASTPTSSLVPDPGATATLGSTNTSAAGTVSFTKDVLPILQNRCINCHGGQATKAGLSIASYGALMAGSQNGPVVIAGDPANSLLIQMIQQGKMPKRGSKLTPDQLQILIDWITAGAMNN